MTALPVDRAHVPPSAHRAPHGRPLVSRRALLALAPVLTATLASCSGSLFGGNPATALTSTATRQQVPLAEAPALEEAVAACDALGAAMITDALARAPEENALASPLSLALALALLAPGATDPQSIDALLGASGQDRNQTWSAIQNSLLRNDVDDSALEDFDPQEIPEAPLVHAANRVLIIDDLQVSQTYLDTVHQWFDADTERVPRSQAKKSLDAWVKHETGGLIDKSAVEVTPDISLVLQNAILFAARWLEAFEPNHTAEDSTFTLANGSTTTCDLMHMTHSFTHVEGQGWAALRIPYLGAPDPSGEASLVMDVILPQAGTSPADLPEETWAQASAALEAATDSDGGARTVNLALPRLDLASGPTPLMPLLTSLGMAVGPLDNMAPDLRVGQVVQQVRLIVREDGTVAAAVTEIGVDATAAIDPQDPIDFIVDHPYVLRLCDRANGATLIQAAIMNPV